MNSLIVLATITVAIYGKAQCQCSCNNTDAYKVQQYCCNTYDSCDSAAVQQLQYNNDSIYCSSNESCPAEDVVKQFIEEAKLLTNELGIMLNSTIINNTRILVINNSDVSFVDSSGIYIHLFFHRTQMYITTALK